MSCDQFACASAGKVVLHYDNGVLKNEFGDMAYIDDCRYYPTTDAWPPAEFTYPHAQWAVIDPELIMTVLMETPTSTTGPDLLFSATTPEIADLIFEKTGYKNLIGFFFTIRFINKGDKFVIIPGIGLKKIEMLYIN